MGNGGGGKEAQKEEDICKLIAENHSEGGRRRKIGPVP